MTQAQTRTLTIEFVGISEGEAEIKTERLIAMLEDTAQDIAVGRLADPKAQSAGIILTVTLGPPAALILAAALEDFICRDDTRLRISANAETVFEGASGQTAVLPGALTAAVKAW